MRRILFQVIILALFLFLTVFASVWFEDAGGKESAEPGKYNSFFWFSQSIKQTWSLFDALLGGASKNDESTGKKDASEPAAAALVEIDKVTKNVGDLALAPSVSSLSSDSNFSEFLRSFLNKAPSMYFDTKVYSNGWRNFWSLYWLKYKDLEAKTGE